MNKDNVFNPNFLNQPQQVQKNKDDIEYLIKNQFKVFNTPLDMFEGMESVSLSETDIPADFSGENAVLLTRNGLIFKIVTITDNMVYIKYYSQLPAGPQGPTGPSGGLPEYGEPDQVLARYGYGDGEYGWVYGKVPSGGSPNQVLTKYGYGDNEYQWQDPQGGGGGGGGFDPNLLTEITNGSSYWDDISCISDYIGYSEFDGYHQLLFGSRQSGSFNYGGTYYSIGCGFGFSIPVISDFFNVKDGKGLALTDSFLTKVYSGLLQSVYNVYELPENNQGSASYDTTYGGQIIQNVKYDISYYLNGQEYTDEYSISHSKRFPFFGTNGINIDANENTSGFNISLDNEVSNKLARALVTPVSAPVSTELVGIGTNNTQTNITIGSGLTLSNNTLTATASSPTYMYYASFEVINAASYNSKIQMTAFSSGEKIVPDGNAKNFLKQLVTRIAASDALSATPANIKYPATGTINDTPIKYAECISTGSLSVYGTGDENTIYNFDNEDTTVANFQVSVLKV